MTSNIAQRLVRNRRVLACVATVGAAVLAADLILIVKRQPYETRAIGAAVCVVFYLLITRLDNQSLGLRPVPVQGFRYWTMVTIIIVGIAGVLISLIAALLYLTGHHPPIPRLDPKEYLSAAMFMCVWAPLVEEVIYRFAVCVPSVALFGPLGAVIVSGSLFTAIHFLYGNPGPDNMIAGFFLAWAYIRSGTLLVPLLWHAGGNFVALNAHVAAWYLIGPPAQG